MCFCGCCYLGRQRVGDITGIVVMVGEKDGVGWNVLQSKLPSYKAAAVATLLSALRFLI